MKARAFGMAVASFAVLLAAGTAEARFGKRSEASSDSSDEEKSSDRHEAAPAPSKDRAAEPSQPAHEARPGPSYREGDRHHHHRPRRIGYPYYDDYRYGWGFGYYPWFWAPAPVVVAPREEPAASSITGTVGVTGQLHNQQGATIGVDAAAEGERWGVRGAFAGIFAPSEGGAAGELDSIKLLDLHLTYAVVSGSHGRLRIELGGTMAFAPDMIALAPDAGISGAMGLIGPLGLEATVSYAPWPFQRIDAMGGLSVSLGPVGIRGGWRHLWLDDRGAVDGVRHTDTFTGPFVGLSLAL